METHTAERNGVEGVWHELVELVNRQFETPPFRRLLGISGSPRSVPRLCPSR